MAGSAMTFAYEESASIRKVTVSWTSDSQTGGVAGSSKKVSGSIVKIVTDPGSAAPSADYDIVITDPEGLNVLGLSHDDLIDRHTTNTEAIYCNMKPDGATVLAAYPVVSDVLTFTVAAAGNSKTGQIILYMRNV